MKCNLRRSRWNILFHGCNIMYKISVFQIGTQLFQYRISKPIFYEHYCFMQHLFLYFWCLLVISHCDVLNQWTLENILRALFVASKKKHESNNPVNWVNFTSKHGGSVNAIRTYSNLAVRVKTIVRKARKFSAASYWIQVLSSQI